MKVIEIKGLPHTLTLKNGKTLRIFARQQLTVADNQISEEFYAEQRIGDILLLPEEKVAENKKGGSK